MIHTSEIISKSSELFNEFTKINDTLYKGNYLINENLAGIYYLSFSDEITEEEFENIQYKYLAEEFYGNEDTLQWNIYLLFINCNISDELKSKIITDDKYARKMIFKESEFIDYFQLEKSSQYKLPDIVSEWKSNLDSVDLQEVYSNHTYVDIVDRFLNKSTIKNEHEEPTETLENTLTVNNITSLSLKEDYREFPLTRKFDFGLVNLISGANGTGKTSLLESIELILTGKSSRNSDKDEANGSILANFNDDNHQEVYTPDDYAKYKSRDIKWYSRNHLTRGNNCYKSFNQFNFFNTDAAYQFAFSEHQDEINNSLKQVILGSEYAFISDRISGVEKRLKLELKALNKNLSEKKEENTKNIKRVDELKLNKNFEQLKKNIFNNIISLNYKQPIQEDNFSVSSLCINEIKTEIEYILNQKTVLTLNTLNKLQKQVDEQLDFTKSVSEKYNKGIDRRADLINELKSLDNHRKVLKSFKKYFVVKDIGMIENIENQLQNLNSKLSIIEKIKSEISSIKLDSFMKNNKVFSSLKSFKSETLEKLLLTKQGVEAEIKTLSDNFSMVEGLVNKLKLLGKELLSHNEHSKNCPLCEQQISHIELSNKLNEDFKKDIDKTVLNDKYIKLNELQENESKLISDLIALKGIESISQGVIPKYETLTVKELISELKSILMNEEQLVLHKSKIESTLAQITDIGGSITEFISLKKQLKKHLKFNDSLNIDELNKKLLNVDSQIQDTENELESIEIRSNKLISSLNKKLQLKDFTNEISIIIDKVNSQKERLSEIDNSFNKINQYLKLPLDKPVSEISKLLYTLEENIKTYEDSKNRQSELQKLTNDIQEAQSFIKLNEKRQIRLDKAVEVLNNLKSNDGESILGDFFDGNLKEIIDIFKTLHLPNEFTDLRFEDKKLVLYKNNEPYSISQISTGQRAALVLSIFISLNRKNKNGPNIIIFDDPVTFIDDFNALSFLDFLRYFIVKENKQIFFATANKKFAALFKKKFEFLNSDSKKEFREYELYR